MDDFVTKTSMYKGFSIAIRCVCVCVCVSEGIQLNLYMFHG